MTALDWTHATTDIPETGRRFERAATEAERRAVADALDLVGCERLDVSYELRPLAGGRYRLAGDITADIVQSCVVSLEPIEQRVAENFEVTFCPPASLPEADTAEREILSEPDVEPIADGRIDAGRVIFELVASAIDPYPRKEGAALDWQAPADTPGEASPFAVLAKLKGGK
jgi:uncharacterized metal-binding protein YceD (DUF177 family)